MYHKRYRIFVRDCETNQLVHSQSCFASRRRAIDRGWLWTNEGFKVVIIDTITGGVIWSLQPRGKVENTDELEF